MREEIYSLLEYKNRKDATREQEEQVIYFVQWSTHPQGEQNKRKNVAMVWIDNKKHEDMVLLSWIIDCLKMYKISDKVKKFITETMKNWKVELTTEGTAFIEVKIQWGFFQGDALSPLLFVVAKMPLNYILRKCTGGYKLTNSQEKVYQLMYMDDIEQFARN